ncbi:hypothetical protein PHMEG_00012619 [Phytophthora megakarya]|uniref:Uncharacterized protein n=1 Tax=Phytophthora megakarya TaxID=4795 RepID=A0A225W8S1_9STRA|nr:hypothetical protein PHMEG_00012619 [Phytophthora megakarya]
MANLSPSYASMAKSLCSMRFAQKVRHCERGAPVRPIKATRHQSLGPGDVSRSSTKNSPPRENR